MQNLLRFFFINLRKTHKKYFKYAKIPLSLPCISEKLVRRNVGMVDKKDLKSFGQ